MYLQRSLTRPFLQAMEQFPAVLITGPRQSGKSTFLRHVLPQVPYFTFDDPLNRDFVRTDPTGVLNQFTGKAMIIDEVQYVPEILPYIKMRIDEQRILGNWILTGSQQFHLMKGVGETLAGRIAIMDLLPFCLNETQLLNKSLTQIIWDGLFPDPSCHCGGPHCSDNVLR